MSKAIKIKMNPIMAMTVILPMVGIIIGFNATDNGYTILAFAIAGFAVAILTGLAIASKSKN